MKQDYIEDIDKMCIEQLESNRRIAQNVLDALAKGEIKENLALDILSEVRSQIVNNFNQRISIFHSMGMPVNTLEAKKKDELNSLDDAVYKISKKNIKSEELDSQKTM